MTNICLAGLNNNDMAYPKGLSPGAMMIARKELLEESSTKEEALRELREWIIKHPQLSNCRTGRV